MDRFERWMGEVVARGLHKKAKILAGITPIRSLGMLRYMKNSVAGVSVPDALLKRFEDSADAKEEGRAFCLEQLERFRKMEGLAGVHIMAIEAEGTVAGIVKEAGLLPRPQAA
jgi:methylenetetrahydrofolate reductase (NADPH)